MIICSCNRLSDRDVRACCRSAQGAPARVLELYTRLGCAPQCGRCARTLQAIMREARDPGCACGPADCDCAKQAEKMRAA